MNASLAAMAARKGALFIDAYGAFPPAGEPLTSLIMEDGIHLRAAGYRLWSRIIAARFGL